MARAGMLLIKWLLFPAALAAVGYFFVGPRIGKLSGPVASSTPIQDSAQQATDKKQTAFPQPEVDVSVDAVKKPKEKPKKRRRRHTTKPAVSKPTADPVAPPVESTTGGGTTGAGTGGDTGRAPDSAH